MPARCGRPTPLTLIFAHRGDTRVSRENTVAAFEAARERGADGVELDVHLSLDGVVVVHHDADVPGRGPIPATRRRELPAWLPSLEEAVGACAPLRVNVEIKYEPAAGADYLAALTCSVAGALAGCDEPDRFVVSSFSLEALDRFRGCSGAYSTALLVDAGFDPVAALEIALRHGHLGLHPFYEDVGAELVVRARGEGVPLRPWTVDDPAWLARLGALGVDAVITDDVELAARCLRPGR